MQHCFTHSSLHDDSNLFTADLKVAVSQADLFTVQALPEHKGKQNRRPNDVEYSLHVLYHSDGQGMCLIKRHADRS